MLLRTIYTSQTTAPLSQANLERLLAKSRSNNRRDGITGMLCIWHGIFAQCLEGDPEKVSRTFERIEEDSRHTSVRVLGNQCIDERHFGDWSMHLVNLNQQSAVSQFIHTKYPKKGLADSMFTDQFVVFSLLFDLASFCRSGSNR